MLNFAARIILKIVLISYFTFFLEARERISLISHVDWSKRLFTFVLSTSVNPKELPSSKQRAEGLIHRSKDLLITEGLSKFCLDQWGAFHLSQKTFRTGLNFDLYKATQFAKKDYVSFSPNMRRVQVSYTLPFEVLTKSIIRSGFDFLKPLLVAGSSFNYTGIVINSTSHLPIKGREPLLALVAPALLASLISSDGRDLVTPNTISEKFFKKWGTVAYSSSLDEETWPIERIGAQPLIIPGKSVRGPSQSTLEISDRYADMLLSSDKGMQILLEGRILFLINEESLDSTIPT